MLTKGLLIAVARVLVAFVLSIVLLAEVVSRSGPQTSEVVVHLTEFPARLTIDGRSYPVSTLHESPIVSELGRGWHELRVWRDDRLVYREDFRVQPGENLVLTACDLRGWTRSEHRAGAAGR